MQARNCSMQLQLSHLHDHTIHTIHTITQFTQFTTKI